MRNIQSRKLKENFTDFIHHNFYYNKKININTGGGGKPRIEFIDLAKGICILLVVVYHIDASLVDFPGLNALRMPLYFILSGLFFKNYGGFLRFFEKKTNKILIPFLVFFSIDYIRLAFHRGDLYLKFWLSPINAPFAMENSPIWFLAALFMCNIMFYLCFKISRNSIILGLIMLMTGFIGYQLTTNNIYLPFYTTQAINGLPFFYVGWLIKKTPLLYPNKYDKFNLLLASTLIGCSILICSILGITPRIDFRLNEYTEYAWLVHPISIAMVIGTLLFCKYLKWLPIISYFGRYSIVTLCLHKLLIVYLGYYLIIKYGFKWVEGPVLCFLVIMICWLAIPFLTRIAPIAFAQKDLVKFPTRLYNKN